MKIPESKKEDCDLCAKMDTSYDEDCRECFIRRIAQTPFKHRGDIYRDAAIATNHAVMAQINDEVIRYHLTHTHYVR